MLRQFFYKQYQVKGLRKNTRPWAEVKDFKLKFLNNVALRYKSLLRFEK